MGYFLKSNLFLYDRQRGWRHYQLTACRNCLGCTIIEKTTFPIHFEDRSGIEFERLVFAFVCRIKNWDKVQWLGETGNDNGRDIWGEYKGSTFCFQCANQRHLPFKKVKDDIDKLVKNNLIPDCLILVCNRITDNMRTLFKSYAGQFGIKETEVWRGFEFEEKLRKDAPEIFKRFVEGDAFPKVPACLL